mgnify:CR=1 FL=1
MFEVQKAFIKNQSGESKALNPQKVNFAGRLVARGVISHTVACRSVGDAIGGIMAGACLTVAAEKCSGHVVCQGESGSTHRNIRP